MSDDLDARTKAAFKEYYEHFPANREHAANTLMYMVRAYWRGKMHCTKLHTRFEGHAKTFRDLNDIKAYIEDRLKNNYCPVHGTRLLTPEEQATLQEIMIIDDLYVKKQDEMEAAMNKSAEEHRRLLEEARQRELDDVALLLDLEDR